MRPSQPWLRMAALPVVLILGCADLVTAPSGLSYRSNPAAHTVGVASTANTATVTGAKLAFSVNPALPAGLTLNSGNGTISGTPTAAAVTATYVVTAANSAGSTRCNLVLTVAAGAQSLVITAQPGNQSVLVGQTARFSVTAAGTGALTYQWLKNGAAIAGANGSSYVTPAVASADDGALFSVLVHDGAGGSLASSSGTLTVTTQAAGISSLTGSLATGRSFHTATRLVDGKVLVAGGFNGVSLADAELYDPASFTFSAAGGMLNAREFHTATLLQNGKVLIAGGNSSNTVIAGAELYDPATGTFTATGSMGTARANHSATLLADGTVLLAGGRLASTYHSSAEIYDPVAGTFSPTAGGLAGARATHTATLLADGRVLVAGGNDSADLASAELYDPATRTFSPAGAMNSPRAYHTATLLSNGGVLMVGGTTAAATEIFNPAANLFAASGNLQAVRHFWHATALLPSGKVLVAGGVGAGSPAPLLASGELYNPTLGTFAATGSLVDQREAHTATLLADGRVLVVGGSGGAGYLDSAELYQ